MAVYVYAGDAEDTLSIGLAGELFPTKCEFEEIANGLSQVTLTHPMDDGGKWAYLTVGRLLKVPVPVRTTPEINMANPNAPTRVTSVETWRVKPAASKADRCLYKKATGSKKGKKLLAFGAMVTVVQLGTNRHKCKTPRGTGWVNVSGIEYVVTSTIPNTNSGIESAQPPARITDQLFRIISVDVNLDNVDVKARHIFYDLTDNITSYSAASCSIGAALHGISTGCKQAHEFEFYTDVADTRSVIQYTRISPINALLDPEDGVAARWGLKLIRDDYEAYFLSALDTDRGGVIEYGSNMMDMTVSYDDAKTVTRLMPMGEDKKGNFVYLPELYVDSPKILSYPRVKLALRDYTETCSMKRGLTISQVYTEMRRLAALEYSADHIDDVETTVTVKFVDLGDSEEFARFRGQDRMYLYDTETVKHARAGINLKADVTRIKWDAIGGPNGEGRMLEVDVSNVRMGARGQKIPAWKVQPVKKVASGVVGAIELAADVGTVMDITGNPATWQVGFTYSAPIALLGITAESVTITGHVMAGGADITAIIDAGRLYWTRDTGDTAADATWAAAHTGTVSITVTAAERLLEPEYTLHIEGEAET